MNKKESKESIKIFRDQLTALAKVTCDEGLEYRALAYASAAIQVSGEDSQSQYLYEILYWAHWKIGNFHESKNFFNMAMGHDHLKEKYLKDYKFYYQLPSISIIVEDVDTWDGVFESEYQKTKLEVATISDNVTGDWLMYFPKGYSVDKYTLIKAIKIANDNGKQCITFSDKKCWGIKRDLYEKLIIKILGAPVVYGDAVKKIIEAADKETKYIHCELAKVYKNN